MSNPQSTEMMVNYRSKDDFGHYFSQCQRRVNDALARSLPLGQHARLKAAMHHAVLQGGKRVRPFLVYASAQCYGVTHQQYLDDAACAVECVHSYSLVHDDLPAMDNDEWRRGAATIHKTFGEATAILCGDALLTQAFGYLAYDNNLPAVRLQAVRILAECAGVCGMVGGQQEDMDYLSQTANSKNTRAVLKACYHKKTALLMQAALRLGALPVANEKEVGYLEEYAYNLGQLFQVRNDIADSDGQGSDSKNNKVNTVLLLGRKKAQQLMESYAANACSALAKSKVVMTPLLEFTHFLLHS